MGPDLAGRFPNAGSFIACLVAARFLGLGPAILVIATALAEAFLLRRHPELAREVIFLVTSGVAVAIVEILQRSKAKAEEQARLAAARLQELQRTSALRQEEESRSAQLRAIVESSEDAILSEDMDGIVRSWNLGA
jgi:PAS domain-containing protein